MTMIYMDMVPTGGMPEMVFEYILKENGIDPEKDLTIIQNIDFGSTAPAFADGRGDFTIEFEPGATSLESEGKGHVIASLGKDKRASKGNGLCPLSQSFRNRICNQASVSGNNT